MTSAQSTARLILYVAAAALTVLSSDFAAMADATTHQWIGLFLKAALAGVVAGRAYIDVSPDKVVTP